LRLDDVTGAFEVEPTSATGSTSVSIRVANGSLDYENPNQRKFIILVSTYVPPLCRVDIDSDIGISQYVFIISEGSDMSCCSNSSCRHFWAPFS
jgi:hypothetical protein